MVRSRARVTTTLVLALFPVGYGLFGVHLGQDASFDILNYHYFDPYWLLSNHLYDLLPGQEQTYLSPILNLPTYYLQRSLPAVGASFIIGAVQGLAILPLYVIARTVTSSRWVSIALSMLGMFGAIAWSEIGTSFGDNLVAILLLGAIAAVARSSNHDLSARSSRWVLPAAGLLAGVGAGLKLAEAPIAIGFLLAVPLLSHSTRGRIVAISRYLAGLVVGVGVSYGYWAYELTSRFHNPVLPFFNNIFHSPFAPIASNADPRFLPSNIVQLLFYPFVWTMSPLRVEEVSFRELSVPICELLLLVALASRLYRFARTRRWLAMFASVNERYLVVGATLGLLVWAHEFGTYRYITTLEMLSFILLFILSKSALAGLSRLGGSTRVFPAVATALCMLCVLTEQPANFGRTHFSGKYISVALPAELRKPHLTILMLTGYPYAYMVPFFPASTDVIRIQGNLTPTPYVNQLIEQRLKTTSPIYITWVTVEKRGQFIAENASAWMKYGLTVVKRSCSHFFAHRGVSREVIRFCQVARSVTTANATSASASTTSASRPR